ncbi:MAG: hypothetical protein E2O38_12870 [Proteobacteria bacterium]|nr:MAG: hypothetical protein E2O38_12870 [Pseudomonadota bacterium]
MNQQPTPTESKQRIRAAVRVVLSPGVWLVIGLQVVFMTLRTQTILPLGDFGPTGLALVIFGTLLILIYLMSGTFRSFALGNSTVSIYETLSRGKEVFASFLWLLVQVGLLAVVAGFVLLNLLYLSRSVDLEQLITEMVPYVTIIAMVVPFLLVYWFPVVFSTNDFRVFATLRSALRIIWQRLWRSGFLAFLIFFPLVAFWLLPDNSPLIVFLIVSVIGEMMGWTAYVYCVESLASNPSWVTGST